jgi:hypothetical protein
VVSRSDGESVTWRRTCGKADLPNNRSSRSSPSRSEARRRRTSVAFRANGNRMRVPRERLAEADAGGCDVRQRRAQRHAGKELTTPQRKRDAALEAMARYDISRRCACRLFSIDPKTVRREPEPGGPDIRVRMRAIAGVRRRLGHRRIGLMLEREGFAGPASGALRPRCNWTGDQGFTDAGAMFGGGECRARPVP